jgi:zona occludens toxin
VAQASVHADVSDVSDVWRIVGHYQVGHETFVAIANSSGSIRLEHPSVFQNTGLSMVGTVDGLRVMYWSGAHPQQAKIIQ